MSSSLMNNTLLEIEQQITRYVYSAWLIFGIPGGLLNLLIFSRPKMLKTSCCVYFFATSLNNLISLGVGVIPVLYSLNNPDPLTSSDLFCKVRGYFLQITLMVSRWFISFACIDRYATSSRNARLRTFANVRIAIRSVIGIIIVWFIIASHRLIFYEVKGNLCAILSNAGASMYHTIYILLGGGILPTTIMITCAILIRHNLSIKRRHMNHVGNAHAAIVLQHQRESMDHQVLILLYVQIGCYIVLMTPQMGNVTYNAVVTRIPNRSTYQYAIDRLFAFLAELMMYVFPVTSFYLYTLSSPTFRMELWHILSAIPLPYLKQHNRRTIPIDSMKIDHHIPNHLHQALPCPSPGKISVITQH